MQKHISTRRCVLSACLLALAVAGQAAPKIDFGKITSSKEQMLREYWQLNDEEARRFKNYMETVGQYRNPQVDPLTVLALTANSDEDRAYYARKAAEYEHRQIMREIEVANLMHAAMAEERLEAERQQLTDRLTGIDTTNDVPYALEPAWRAGDELFLLLDKNCLSAGCVSQFAKAFAEVAQDVSRTIIVKGTEPLSDAAAMLVEGWPDTTVTRFDPVEHGFLGDSWPNRPLHVRDRVVLPPAPPASAAAKVAAQPANPAAASGKTAAPPANTPANSMAPVPDKSMQAPANPGSSNSKHATTTGGKS